jgi:hypothetical protein
LGRVSTVFTGRRPAPKAGDIAARRRGCVKRQTRYNEEFEAFIESVCQESGDLRPVDEEFYEAFVAYTEEEMVAIVELILRSTASVFNEKLFSGAWKSDDEMYEFVMTYLELIAEGKLAFDEETGKILFLKPGGDPPSNETWNRIQKKIDSSRSAIRKAIVNNVQGRGKGHS